MSQSNIELVMSVEGLKKLSGGNNGVQWTTDRAAELPIHVSTDPNSPASAQPFTVPQMFQNTVNNYPDKVALRVEREGKWVEWTYTQYYNECRAFAKALIANGFQPHQGVSIIGFNAPEWHFADLGAILAGGIAAGIYTTNGPEACHYIAEHSEATVVVVEDDVQLQKFLLVRDRLPHLKSIVQYIGEPRKIPGVYSWKDWLATGASLPEATLDARMAAQRPGECCTLIYTSGTTGNPKAVMLSHDNITWTSAASSGLADICADDSIVSYLPMSHIAAQLTDLMSPLLVGMEVSFARPDALKGSLVETLQQVRPTVMMGVPRVWEKIEEKMRAVGAANTGIKKAVGDWAKSIGVAGSKAKLKGEPLPWGWTLANAVVFSNVKKALGLDRCRLRATGAAPITMKTMEYFMSLDLTLFELYGMSESTGPHSMNHPEVGYTKMGSVGQTMPGVETKIDRPDAKGEGEICMRGRHIFMGYMKNEDATKKDIDSEGWLHTGDIGRMDEKGFINITGRIKELIITAGGENIPPVLIEETLKAKAPAISNAMLIGDKRKFLTCLVSLKTEPDAEGNPTNKLFGPALELAKSVKSKARTVEEAVQDPKIIAAIQHAVDKANKLATSRAQRISKWTFITTDFSIAGGELTPTMKLKRRVVAAMYSDVIEAFYADDATAPLPSKL